MNAKLRCIRTNNQVLNNIYSGIFFETLKRMLVKFITRNDNIYIYIVHNLINLLSSSLLLL